MLMLVDKQYAYGSDGCTQSGEAEDEHGRGVGGIGLVGATYKHRYDGTAEVLDKEYHRVGCAQAL